MLSTIVTILHIRSSDFIHLIAENLYLYQTFPISCLRPPATSVPGNHFSTFCFYENFFFSIPHVNDTMQYLSFFAWLISLSSPGLTMLLQIQDFLLVQGRRIILCVCVCMWVPHFLYPLTPTNPEVGFLDNLVVLLHLPLFKCIIQWY